MSGRDRILVMVVAFGVIAAGVWFGLVAPKRGESADLASQLDAARAELAQATEQTSQAEAAQKRFGEDVAAVATLGKAVPEDDQTASLLYQLDTAAGRSDVELTSIAPAGAAAPGTTPSAPTAGLPAGVTEYGLTLIFKGRFADLQAFLRRAHGNTTVRGDDIRVRGRLLSIDGVQLTPGEDGRVEATVTAKAFMASPPADTAAAPPAAPAPDTTAAAAPPTQPAMIGAGG